MCYHAAVRLQLEATASEAVMSHRPQIFGPDGAVTTQPTVQASASYESSTVQSW